MSFLALAALAMPIQDAFLAALYLHLLRVVNN